MRQEVLDYYDGLNIPIKKMINVGLTRKNLTAAAVKTAAVEVYEDIRSGKLKIPNIRVAWEVFSRAKTARVESDAKESQVIKDMKRELAYLKLPWWKKLKRRMRHE